MKLPLESIRIVLAETDFSSCQFCFTKSSGQLNSLCARLELSCSMLALFNHFRMNSLHRYFFKREAFLSENVAALVLSWLCKIQKIVFFVNPDSILVTPPPPAELNTGINAMVLSSKTRCGCWLCDYLSRFMYICIYICFVLIKCLAAWFLREQCWSWVDHPSLEISQPCDAQEV